MLTEGDRDEIIVTIHGLRGQAEDSLVSADVFAQKVNALVRMLKRGDKHLNQRPHLSFFISHLKTSSAEVGLKERPRDIRHAWASSSVSAVVGCADAIFRGNFRAARQFNGIATDLANFSHGTGTKFSHIEIGIKGAETVSIDSFFERQATQFVLEEEGEATEPKFFRGQCADSFDGYLKEADFRGRLVRGILIMTGTKKQIDCVFTQKVSETEIEKAVNHRIWSMGNSIYDGRSQLPAKIEVNRIKHIKTVGDPSRWIGVLEDFEPDSWGLDESDLH